MSLFRGWSSLRAVDEAFYVVGVLELYLEYTCMSVVGPGNRSREPPVSVEDGYLSLY